MTIKEVIRSVSELLRWSGLLASSIGSLRSLCNYTTQFFKLARKLFDLRFQKPRNLRHDLIGNLHNFAEVVFDALVVIPHPVLNGSDDLCQTNVECVDDGFVVLEGRAVSTK